MGGYKSKLIFSLLIIAIVLPAGLARAETAPTSICNGQEIVTTVSTVVINEVQTNGVGSGTTDQEFIELKNTGPEAVDISGWKLRYVASSGNYSATPQYLVTFPEATFLQTDGFILATPITYTALSSVIPKFTYAASYNLAATGGSVVLVNATGIAVDLVGWGSGAATCRETSLATAPTGGTSIQRKVIDQKTLDTNDNLSDFELLTIPTPQTNNSVPNSPDPLPEDEEVNPSPDEPQPDDTNSSPTDPITNEETEPPTQLPESEPETSNPTPEHQPILINELFIDPTSPLTDANDEWIELYNPSALDQNLAGYTVFAGETYNYHHTFTTNDIITAKGYVSITSKDTSIALSNSGGRVKIVSPTGFIYDEAIYTSAEPGESWAKDANGAWVWTTTPTQNTTNIITQPIPVAVVAKAATSAKKASTKTTVAKASTAAAKTTKVKAASTTQDSQPQLVAAPTPLPLWLLALLGVLALLYSGYEYRFDIANKIYQFRQYRTNRPSDRR